MRQGQAYAVNGMRPEQNVYLVDGAQNMNRMDGGFANAHSPAAREVDRIVSELHVGGALPGVGVEAGGRAVPPLHRPLDPPVSEQLGQVHDLGAVTGHHRAVA